MNENFVKKEFEANRSWYKAFSFNISYLDFWYPIKFVGNFYYNTSAIRAICKDKNWIFFALPLCVTRYFSDFSLIQMEIYLCDFILKDFSFAEHHTIRVLAQTTLFILSGALYILCFFFFQYNTDNNVSKTSAPRAKFQ